jgi:hypothetical protein
MAKTSKFKNLKNDLRKDAKKAFDTREQGGFRSERYIDEIVFDDFSFFVPVEGKNAIDVIPFIHATDLFKAQGKSKGDISLMLDVFVHKSFNQRYSRCICPRRTFGKPCALCDERDRLRALGEDEYKDEIASLKPKHRTIMNVVSLKENEDDEYNGQIQVFDETQWFFAKELVEEAESDVDSHGDAVDWYTPEEGKSVVFRANKNKKFNYFTYKSFTFDERDEAYPEDIVELSFKDKEYDHGAFPLDALLKIHTCEEQLAMYNENVEDTTSDDDDEEEYEETSKSKKRATKRHEEEDNEDEVEEEDDATFTCPYGKRYGVDGDMKDATCKKCKNTNVETFMNCIVESSDQ